ncbi:MAG: hypothetical protein IMZ61_04515 [Planctomycetes bacterium]|nr:hypothetical protein [Planctomycetota bacterium]
MGSLDGTGAQISKTGFLWSAIKALPFPSETQYVGFIRANYLALFPKLVDQSQFNRRAQPLRLLIEYFRR